MAHERLAKDEAIQRAGGEKQAVEQALQRSRANWRSNGPAVGTLSRSAMTHYGPPRPRSGCRTRPGGVPGAAEALTHGLADQDTDTNPSGTRKACETVSRMTRRPTSTMPATEALPARSGFVGVGDRCNPISQRRKSWNGGSPAGGFGFGNCARRGKHEPQRHGDAGGTFPVIASCRV
jgi:hypothetical protein